MDLINSWDKYPFNKDRWQQYKDCQKKYIETGDCDPAYPVLNYMSLKKDISLEDKYWLAFIYSACYSDATAWAMFKTMPVYTDINEKNLNKWWETYKDKFVFTTDRAKVKNFNKVVPMFLSYKKLIGNNQDQKFMSLQQIDGHKTYDKVYNYLDNIYYVGRFSLFLLTEIIHVLTGYPMVPTGLDLKDAESSRNGLCYALGADNWVKNKLNKNQYDYLYYILDKLIIETQDLNMNYWNIETFLCAYKKYYWKTRYLGFYLDRQLEGLLTIEQNFPELKTDWELFWKARKSMFDNNYLGELNNWKGIRKDMMGYPITQQTSLYD